MFKFFRKNKDSQQPKQKKSESFKSILWAIFLALVFRSSVASPYKIPSGSMIPTLKIGDFIFVSKLSYGIKVPFTNYNFVKFSPPKRGDVVVFVEPRERQLDYIKRVVGVAGDKIELKNDKLYVNDKLMERVEFQDPTMLEDYPSAHIRDAATLYKENIDGVEHTMMEFSRLAENFGPVVVPPDSLFMMGDNRDNSGDSRVWGFLPVNYVRGKAKFIWLSLDSVHPYFFFGFTIPYLGWDCLPAIRFNRFGKTVI